jgi:hypothetical protein
MTRIHGTTIRQFRDTDLVPVRRLIHHTIDVCYTSVYLSRACRDVHKIITFVTAWDLKRAEYCFVGSANFNGL